MAPSAPGLLSTTKRWPSFASIPGDRVLNIASETLPAANGITTRIGFVGQSWARPAAGPSAIGPEMRSAKMRPIVVSPRGWSMREEILYWDDRCPATGSAFCSSARETSAARRPRKRFSAAHKLKLMMSYARRFKEEEVPDPYYGGPRGFERVLDMLEDAAQGLLESLRIPGRGL